MRWALLLAVLVAVAGCGGGGGGSTAGAEPIPTAVVASGEQLNPPVTSAATARGLVTISGSLKTLILDLTFSGMANVTDVEIRSGSSGQTGPILFQVYNSQFGGAFPDRLKKNLDAKSFQSQAGVATFENAVLEILNGKTYLLVRTAAKPQGEIRGQIGAATAKSVLTTGNVVPPVAGTARGTVSIQFNETQTQFIFDIQSQNLDGVKKIEIHYGAAGENGPALFTILDTRSTPYTGQFNRAQTASHFTSRSEVGIRTFRDVVNAFLSGKAHVVVTTTAHPEGEVRGQITP